MLSRMSVRAVCLQEDVRTALPVAKRLGYRGVQLDMVIGELSLQQLDGSGRREVRHLASSHDLEIESVRAEVPPGALSTPTDHDRLLWLVRQALEVASGIGTHCLCVDIGRLPRVRQEKQATAPVRDPGLIIIPSPRDQEIGHEPAIEPAELALWDGVDAVMREIGALADRIGMVVAFSAELSTFASLERMLRVQCPWFGVDLDPVSVLREKDDVEPVLDLVGPLVRHVRARDAVRGSGGRTQAAEIGRGSTNWAEFISLLDSGSFGGWFTVDTVDLPARASAAQRAAGVLAAVCA